MHVQEAGRGGGGVAVTAGVGRGTRVRHPAKPAHHGRQQAHARRVQAVGGAGGQAQADREEGGDVGEEGVCGGGCPRRVSHQPHQARRRKGPGAGSGRGCPHRRSGSGGGGGGGSRWGSRSVRHDERVVVIVVGRGVCCFSTSSARHRHHRHRRRGGKNHAGAEGHPLGHAGSPCGRAVACQRSHRRPQLRRGARVWLRI